MTLFLTPEGHMIEAGTENRTLNCITIYTDDIEAITYFASRNPTVPFHNPGGRFPIGIHIPRTLNVNPLWRDLIDKAFTSELPDMHPPSPICWYWEGVLVDLSEGGEEVHLDFHYEYCWEPPSPEHLDGLFSEGYREQVVMPCYKFPSELKHAEFGQARDLQHDANSESDNEESEGGDV